jgi:alpha-glucosidase
MQGEAASSFHNRYPEEWAKLTRDAVEEAAAAEDVVFFMRSAWTKSPAYTPLFWLGDQLVSWDSNDGLRSVITGALSSGLTGHALTHSDIGGYTVETELGQSMYYVRSPELLKRWTELAAFGFALFRTHIGSSTTSLDAQVYDSPDSTAHFGKFAKIFAHLSVMRRRLMRDASRKGLPMIRPLAMQFGYDAVVWDITEAYMVGEELLVAPCLYEGVSEVRVYLPASSGTWIHLWSGMQVDADHGTYVAVPAPIGFPPVFYRPSSVYGRSLYKFIADSNLSDTVPGRWQLRTSSLTRPSETSPQLLHPSARSYLCSPYAIVLLLCVLFSACRIALCVA